MHIELLSVIDPEQRVQQTAVRDPLVARSLLERYPEISNPILEITGSSSHAHLDAAVGA